MTVTVTQSRIMDSDSRTQRSVKIAVTDTGPGIAAEHLPHIFDRFYQVDETHTTEGTGIGLALAKEFVDLHHGTISVESTPGKGSMFTVTLPIARKAYGIDEISDSPKETEEPVALGITRTQPEQRPATPPSEGKPIVLVVEDNPDLSRYIREYLEQHFAVREARNGKEGCDQAFEIIPDIVVSDIMMPEMDGLELCQALKQDERTSHVPIVLLTARAGTDSKVEGLEIGADDYLTKPFEMKELLARIRNLIELRRKLRERYKTPIFLRPGEVPARSTEDVFIGKVMKTVEEHMSEETFHVDALAESVGMSKVQLHRKLTALTGQAPGELLRSIRLHRAMELLQKNAGTIAEIAYAVGFSDPSYFSKSFHKQFGRSPGDVKKGMM